MGIKHEFSLAFTPQTNSLVESAIETVKTSLHCKKDSHHWFGDLGFVLLGLRSVVKSDLKYTIAELVYGTKIRLPGVMVSREKGPLSLAQNLSNYVSAMERLFSQFQAHETSAQQLFKTHVPDTLNDCKYFS